MLLSRGVKDEFCIEVDRLKDVKGYAIAKFAYALTPFVQIEGVSFSGNVYLPSLSIAKRY